jgi:hypothetical protein
MEAERHVGAIASLVLLTTEDRRLHLKIKSPFHSGKRLSFAKELQASYLFGMVMP